MKIGQIQRRIALAAALALTLAAVFQVDGEDAPSPVVVASKATKPTEPAAASGAVPPPAAEVRLELPQRQPLQAGTEDMFASKSWYVPPPPPPPVPPPPPAPPPLPFTYLGKMLEGDRLTVFLRWQERNLTVKAGDVLDGIYRVEEIRAPQMTLTYLPMKMKQTLYIGEVK